MAFTTEQRKGLVDKIVVNGTFGEDDRDSLNKLSDNQLVALVDPAKLDMVVNKAKAPSMKDFNDEAIMNEYKARFESEEDDEEEEEEEEEPSMPSKPPGKMSANQWMAQAPDEIKHMVANARRMEQQQRESLIEKITTNGACPLTAQELAKRSTEDLQLFASMAAPSNTFDGGFNYSGAAGTMVANRQTKIEPLPVPTASYMD